jgi:histidinol dehydrogenase
MSKLIYLDRVDRSVLDKILRRAQLDISRVEGDVRKIIEDVKARGDKAIVEFYKKMYNVEIDVKVHPEEFEKAYEVVSRDFIEAVEYASSNIREFCRLQKPKSWIHEIRRGVYVGQLVRPVESVGIYVPGGRAAYPSTVLMTAIPALEAGVENIVVTTPPDERGLVNPHVLVALDLLGIRRVYRVGGAHAVAAMSFGTESVPRVQKIVGPGGIWFTAAKAIVRNMGVVDIDFIAGPSEVLVLADDTADPEYVAYDLISQLEHDVYASAVLVTTSENLAKRVDELMSKLVESVERSEIVKRAYSEYGAIIVARDIDQAVEFINEYAPEHLEIHVAPDTAFSVLSKIRNAGSIFIGKYTPVSLGDYILGPNHVLPTGGWAKFRGGLSVLDFLKFIDIAMVVDLNVLEEVAKYVRVLATSEGLTNHYKAVEVRLKKKA